jgi:hypothetical protein
LAHRPLKKIFESYNAGVLSTQGWTFSSGNGEVITGANGTKVLQPYNGGYVQGTHGTANNYTYPTGISVSSAGKAYFSCQMKPRMIDPGYATQTVIGCMRYDGDYPLCTIGVNIASNPVAGDRNGRFCFSSANYSSLQNSENVVMFDAANKGYTFDIAVNLNIINSSTIYASLSYRNVTLGGDWIQSSVLNNVAFDNTYGIQNSARTYVYGYVGGEMDNFQMGMGQVGKLAVKENFESYTAGVLSTQGQGWTFSAGDGEVITGVNGTKVVRPYNYGYVQGTHGTAGQYTYAIGIDFSSSGQAYFSAQVVPRMIGSGYATQTIIGCMRYDGGYPLCTVGVNIADNPVDGDRKGRFCFSSANYSSLQNSENIIMFNTSNQGYLFDIAVNLDMSIPLKFTLRCFTGMCRLAATGSRVPFLQMFLSTTPMGYNTTPEHMCTAMWEAKSTTSRLAWDTFREWRRLIPHSLPMAQAELIPEQSLPGKKVVLQQQWMYISVPVPARWPMPRPRLPNTWASIVRIPDLTSSTTTPAALRLALLTIGGWLPVTRNLCHGSGASR